MPSPATWVVPAEPCGAHAWRMSIPTGTAEGAEPDPPANGPNLKHMLSRAGIFRSGFVADLTCFCVLGF